MVLWSFSFDLKPGNWEYAYQSIDNIYIFVQTSVKVPTRRPVQPPKLLTTRTIENVHLGKVFT